MDLFAGVVLCLYFFPQVIPQPPASSAGTAASSYHVMNPVAQIPHFTMQGYPQNHCYTYNPQTCPATPRLIIRGTAPVPVEAESSPRSPTSRGHSAWLKTPSGSDRSAPLRRKKSIRRASPKAPSMCGKGERTPR